MSGADNARLVAAIILTYATMTDTGDIQRCGVNGKTCYVTMAVADACAMELRSAQMTQVAYRCPGHDHFHLATERGQPPPKDERQQQMSAIAQTLLSIPGRGMNRDELIKAMGWDPAQPKRFRRMLARFERARLVDCDGLIVMVRARSRPVLVQVALTGKLPHLWDGTSPDPTV